MSKHVIFMETLNLSVPVPELPDWMEKTYPELLRHHVFWLIDQHCRFPDKQFPDSGYLRAKILIPLWFALDPPEKQVSTFYGSVMERGERHAGGVKLIMQELRRLRPDLEG